MNFYGLKFGTETEFNSFEEIEFVKKLYPEIPFFVKIGGVEARNDMYNLINMGIEYIIAPMVETVYSFENFVETIKEYSETTKLCINIETATALRNLDSILNHKYMKYISVIKIGRSDLSKSFYISNLENSHFDRIVNNTIKKIKNKNKMVSVGGKINMSNIDKVCQYKTDLINTKNVVLTNTDCCKELLKDALLFEKKLNTLFMYNFPFKKDYYLKSIEDLNKRLNSN